MDSDKTWKASYEGFAVTAPYSVQKLKMQNLQNIKPSTFSKTEDVENVSSGDNA